MVAQDATAHTLVVVVEPHFYKTMEKKHPATCRSRSSELRSLFPVPVLFVVMLLLPCITTTTTIVTTTVIAMTSSKSKIPSVPPSMQVAPASILFA